MKHRIKGHQLVNVNGLKLEFGCDPLHRLSGDITETLLNSMQQHQRCATFLGIMADYFVQFGFQLGRYLKTRLFLQLVRYGLSVRDIHRSHSPMTKSKEPRMATTSLTIWPGKICGRMLRFTNDGARIFSR